MTKGVPNAPEEETPDATLEPPSEPSPEERSEGEGDVVPL